MIPTNYYMERPAATPMAAPMVVGLGHRSVSGATYSSTPQSAAFANPVAANPVAAAVTPWAFGMQRPVGLTTHCSARHLGRPST
jgi:hypothetical protein